MFGDDIVYGPIGFVVFSSKMNQQPSQVVCCYIHGSYQNFHHFHPPQHLLCFLHTNAHTQLLKVCFFWKVQCNCTSNCFGLLQKLHCLPSCLALPFFLSIVLHWMMSWWVNSHVLLSSLLSCVPMSTFTIIVVITHIQHIT